MTTIIEVIYEQGVLRLKELLAVADGEVIEVTTGTRGRKIAGSHQL